MKKDILLAAACIALMSTGCGKTAPDAGKDIDASTQTSSSVEVSQDNAEANTKEDADSTGLSKDITLTTYYYTSQKDGKEVSTGKYADITFSDEIAGKYPKLVEAVDQLTSTWEDSTIQEVSTSAYYYDPEINEDMSFFDEMNVDIIRFDDRMLTIFAGYSSFTGGAHPNHGTGIYNIDPVTGRTYTLSDVLTNPEEFPSIIRAWLQKTYPEILEEIDSFFFEDGDVFEDKLANETYNFSVDENGLHILFSPYEVASYATGYIGCDFTYEEYPNLVLDAFKMNAPSDIESKITRVDGSTKELEAKDYYFSFDEEVDESSPNGFVVSNPSWEYYFNDYYKNDSERHYLSLTQVKEDVTDWLDTDAWARKHGFNTIDFPFTDGIYKYEPYNPNTFSYMYNSLYVSNAVNSDTIINYDLTVLCNGPDDKASEYTLQTEFIRYAKIVDDTLYVELSHSGYTSEEPCNGYIVAIDLNTNQVIFRSEPIVANGFNFQVMGDTIICGYGFTAEPDYIYLLDRYDGKTVAQIPVKSAPYQFEVVDDTLYVATYNTAYEFKISQ